MSVKSKLGWVNSAIYLTGILFVLTMIENCSNKEDGTGYILSGVKTILKTTEDAGQGKAPNILQVQGED